MRPFRTIHHTASKIAIVGGGAALSPGEVSLAHRGILFFDELPEFPRAVLEVLRQPLEDKVITISRVQGTVQYPADFMFIAAMNPCRCGYFKDPTKQCSCSLHDIKKYQSKISGPLLDRFDMILEVPREDVETLLDIRSSDIQDYTTWIGKSRTIQQARYRDTPFTMNAQLTPNGITTYISLSPEIKAFLHRASRSLSLSPRVIHRIIKIARTIADIEDSETIALSHLSESFQYRSKTMFLEQ